MSWFGVWGLEFGETHLVLQRDEVHRPVDVVVLH